MQEIVQDSLPCTVSRFYIRKSSFSSSAGCWHVALKDHFAHAQQHACPVVIDCIISFLNYFPDDGSSITAETSNFLFFVADIRYIIVERHSLKKRGNRSLFDKSMKFGAHVENHKTNKSGYRGASDLTFGDL